MENRIKVMCEDEFRRAIVRMSHEILERNKGSKELAILGIQHNGVFLANRIAKEINKIENTDVELGSINISLYRDDYEKRVAKTIAPSSVDFDIDNKIVILVDDVLYTGRSFRAAIDAIFDMGRPAAIQIAVLVDRGHRELPIQSDYTGKHIPTSPKETIDVLWHEDSGEDGVYITRQN